MKPRPKRKQAKPRDDYDALIAERKAMLQAELDAAIAGDPIAGASLALDQIARNAGFGFDVDTGWLYREEDEEDDIRPY